MFETYKVVIQGTSPLLMARFADDSVENLPGGQNRKRETAPVKERFDDPRAVAERACYRTPDGVAYLPPEAFSRGVRDAAANYKQKKSRASYKKIVPGCVFVQTDPVLLHDATAKHLTHFEVDSRTAVNQRTKGRILVHRPRFNTWFATFIVRIDTSMIEPVTVHDFFSDMGKRIGVGAFRVEKGGPYGMFNVVTFTQVAE